ncbi:MAG: hypothetical protein IKC40_01460 [Oscillospiraceae bacterium]|nr:hypothetical protein [Oscillospiraceae bacterium]MBR6616667.1 hypothetical protein [Oscillospiraceae bacterium]
MHKEEKRYGKKALILVSALTMAMTATVGGTVAWLVAKTDKVTNTFTYGDINIELEETDTSKTPNDEADQGDTDNDPNTNTYEMVPGTKIKKDPTITVEGDSEACWLFVELEESANFADFMTYEMTAGWTELEDGVWYRTTTYKETDQEFGVLKNNEVTVKDTITKADLNALTDTTYPTLTVTAYAVQYEGFATAADAWAQAK